MAQSAALDHVPQQPDPCPPSAPRLRQKGARNEITRHPATTAPGIRGDPGAKKEGRVVTTLYRALDELRKEGFIAKESESEGRQPRRFRKRVGLTPEHIFDGR